MATTTKSRRKRGRPPEEGVARSESLNAGATPQLNQRVQARAQEEEIPVAELIRRSLRHYLENTRVRIRNGDKKVVRYSHEYGGGGVSSESDGDGGW